MKIKTGRIRRRFDEALQDRIISDNMLLMSISALNYEILYNESVSDQKATKYIDYRNQLAKFAIDKGISKDRITEVMKMLSDERYPSYNQILSLITLIKSHSYHYVADYIPDTDMKYKTATELQDTNSQPVIKRNQDSIESEQHFNEICDCISQQFNISPITADMQKKIRGITADGDVILTVLQWYKADIYRALQDKDFHSQFDKLTYIVGIIKKKAPETKEKIEYRKRKEEEFLNNTDFSRVNSYVNNFEPKPDKKRHYNYDDLW